MWARAAWTAIGLALFSFVVLCCGNEIEVVWGSGQSSQPNPIASLSKHEDIRASWKIKAKLGPSVLLKTVLVSDFAKNIEAPSSLSSFEYLDPFCLREFPFRDDISARGWGNVWVEGIAARSIGNEQIRKGEIVRQRVCQKINKASMFEAISWRQPIICLGKTENKLEIGGNIIKHGGIYRNICSQLSDGGVLHCLQGLPSGFGLDFGSVRRFLSRIGRYFGVIQALADEPKLNVKQSNLEQTDYYEAQSEVGNRVIPPIFLFYMVIAGIGGFVGALVLCRATGVWDRPKNKAYRKDRDGEERAQKNIRKLLHPPPKSG
jgi:hypothetical protein